MFSYYGSQYGCNPKYISEYILKHTPKEKFDLVWAFNDLKTKELVGNVRQVKLMSLAYFYELCTSKVIITNYRTTSLFVKRKNQYYIQTWHSSLRLKQIEKDAENVLPPPYIQMAKKDSMKCDLLLSGSRYSTDIFKRSFWFNGEIFEHGTPRNDLLFQSNVNKRDEVLKKLNIPSSCKILLYAPTFRKNNGLDVYDIDYQELSKTLVETFGGDWMILVKLHPHLISKSSELVHSEKVMNVTTYDDIQELLLVANILISDYSSLIFDFLITKRPCLLYIPDIEKYTSSDRKLYFDVRELPFINATSNHDLLEKIIHFDNNDYQQELTKFLNRIGSYEEGKACQCLLERIEKVCFPNKG